MSNRKPSAHSGVVVSESNLAIRSSRAFGSRTDWKIGSYVEQRVAGEVHLRDEPLGERAPEDREVDVRRSPGVLVVAPRVGAGLDRDEAVAALVVGEAAAGAGEVRVERRRVLVDLVRVAAGRVRLPDLDERVRGPAGRPSSSTRPLTTIRSPSGSPACCRVRSASTPRARPRRRRGRSSRTSSAAAGAAASVGARSRRAVAGVVVRRIRAGSGRRSRSASRSCASIFAGRSPSARSAVSSASVGGRPPRRRPRRAAPSRSRPARRPPITPG